MYCGRVLCLLLCVCVCLCCDERVMAFCLFCFVCGLCVWVLYFLLPFVGFKYAKVLRASFECSFECEFGVCVSRVCFECVSLNACFECVF